MKCLLCSLLFLFPLFALAQPAITISTATDTICAGSVANFTASATGVISPHYQWKVNSGNAGTDSALFFCDTLSNGDTITCILTDSVGTILAVSNALTLSVLHPRSAGVIYGADTICYGTSVTMTDSVTGGIWGATNTYATDSAGIVTGVAMMAYECGHIPTPDTITYIVSNVCGTDTAFKPIIVHPYPWAGFFLGDPIHSENRICIGGYQPIYMDCAPEGTIISEYGHTLVSWSYVTGVSVGDDILISTATNFCGTDIYTLPITVISYPSSTIITAFDSQRCQDSAVILLTDTAARYYWNTWSATAGNIKPLNYSKDSVWFIAKTGGIDTINMVSDYQCGTVTTSITVTVNLPSKIDPVKPICTGAMIQFSDSSAVGNWSIDNPAIATIEPGTGLLTSTGIGKETITYTLPNGCYTTQTLQVENCGYVFPNPSGGDATISADTSVYHSYTIVNSIGQILIKGKLAAPNTPINTGSLPPAVYFISLYGKHEKVIKFLKE